MLKWCYAQYFLNEPVLFSCKLFLRSVYMTISLLERVYLSFQAFALYQHIPSRACCIVYVVIFLLAQANQFWGIVFYHRVFPMRYNYSWLWWTIDQSSRSWEWWVVMAKDHNHVLGMSMPECTCTDMSNMDLSLHVNIHAPRSQAGYSMTKAMSYLESSFQSLIAHGLSKQCKISLFPHFKSY